MCLNVRLFERETSPISLEGFFFFFFFPQYNICWTELLQMADSATASPELLCCQPEGPCGGVSAAAASGSLTLPD